MKLYQTIYLLECEKDIPPVWKKGTRMWAYEPSKDWKILDVKKIDLSVDDLVKMTSETKKHNAKLRKEKANVHW